MWLSSEGIPARPGEDRTMSLSERVVTACAGSGPGSQGQGLVGAISSPRVTQPIAAVSGGD